MHLIFFLKATLITFYLLAPSGAKNREKTLMDRTRGHFLPVSDEKEGGKCPHLLASCYSTKHYKTALCKRIYGGAANKMSAIPKLL